jgi:hypothetical protein
MLHVLTPSTSITNQDCKDRESLQIKSKPKYKWHQVTVGEGMGRGGSWYADGWQENVHLFCSWPESCYRSAKESLPNLSKISTVLYKHGFLQSYDLTGSICVDFISAYNTRTLNPYWCAC